MINRIEVLPAPGLLPSKETSAIKKKKYYKNQRTVGKVARCSPSHITQQLSSNSAGTFSCGGYTFLFLDPGTDTHIYTYFQ